MLAFLDKRLEWNGMAFLILDFRDWARVESFGTGLGVMVSGKAGEGRIELRGIGAGECIYSCEWMDGWTD